MALTRKWLYPVGFVLLMVAFSEYGIYFVTQWRCAWPESPAGALGEAEVRALILTDPHIAGIRAALTWWERHRWEWQLRRSFATALSVHSPDLVVVLGDVMEEGWFVTRRSEYELYLAKFRAFFTKSAGTVPVLVGVGNHDVGFHDMITPERLQWFRNAFHPELTRMETINGIPFVLVNSMALEGDQCPMCQGAEAEIRRISNDLWCNSSKTSVSGGIKCQSRVDGGAMPRRASPVLLTHFPLFRFSDKDCHEPDQSEPEDKDREWRPRLEVLSRRATQFLLTQITPRAVFNGHSHGACLSWHAVNNTALSMVPEWTLAPFTWQYRRTPTYLLARFDRSGNGTAVSKCFLPDERTVSQLYYGTATGALIWVVALLALTARRAIVSRRGKRTERRVVL